MNDRNNILKIEYCILSFSTFIDHVGFTGGLENREEIDDFPTRDRSGRKLLAVYADVETAYVKRYNQPTSLTWEFNRDSCVFSGSERRKIALFDNEMTIASLYLRRNDDNRQTTTLSRALNAQSVCVIVFA